MIGSGNFVEDGIEQRKRKEVVLSTTKEPAGESTQGSHSKQHRGGLSGFMYVDVQKHAFSQHMVLGQHSIPKGGKAGFGWNPRDGRMPVTAN